MLAGQIEIFARHVRSRTLAGGPVELPLGCAANIRQPADLTRKCTGKITVKAAVGGRSMPAWAPVRYPVARCRRHFILSDR